MGSQCGAVFLSCLKSMQTLDQPYEPTTESDIGDIARLRSNIQTVTPNMSATDQRALMSNFNDAHSELESINSAASELRLDQQAVITTIIIIANVGSQAVSEALLNLTQAL